MFSITTGCFSRSASAAPTCLATASVNPPGGYPIITANGVRRHLGGTLATAISRLRRFEALGIVREITGQKRNRVYRFDRYIEILDAGWTERKTASRLGVL